MNVTIPVIIWRPLPGVEAARVENDPRLWAGHSTQYGVTLVRAGGFDFWYRDPGAPRARAQDGAACEG